MIIDCALKVISELDRLAERFESIAVDALTLTFLKDNTPEKRICQNLLSVPLSSFGNLAFLDLCAQGNCTNLLSLPCCQWLLDERWHGVLKSVPTTVRVAARICPLTAVAYFEFRAWREARTLSVKLKATEGILGARRPLPPSRSHDSNLHCAPLQRGKDNAHAGNNVDQRNKHLGRLVTTTTSFNQSSDYPATVHDRMMLQYGWNSMQRWNFYLGIWKSPSMKFYLYSLSHLIFLFLFSVVCVYNLHIRISVVEWISLAYVVGCAVEEIRQVVIESVLGEFHEYLTDFWNWIDIVSIGFTGAGFIVRMTVYRSFTSLNSEAYDGRMYLARNLYLVALNLFFMRTLFITSISQIIGPRLKMMADMIRKDLMPLLIVFFIFILSYGVWMQALLHPNSYYEVPDKDDPGNFIRSDKQRLKFSNSLGYLFKRAFYSIFEVIVVTEEEVCTQSDDTCGYKEGYDIVIYFVLVLYACIVNIILINLLIALFSNTVSRIEQKAKALWLAGRYKMVKEYRQRTPLPPPFNVLCIFCETAVFLFKKFKKCACKTPCRHCFKKPSSGNATASANWSEKWDPMNGSSSEEEEVDDSLNWAPPTRDLRVMPMKTMDSKRLEQVTKGNQAGERSVKGRELDALLKFILLQSFSLQDHRYILGSGMSGSSLLNAPTQRSSTLSNLTSESHDDAHYMTSTMIDVKKRLGNIEVILDRMLSQFEGKPAAVTAKITSTSSSMSPRPLRIPIPSTTFSSVCDYRDSVRLPTAKELAGEEVPTSRRKSKPTSKPTE